MIEKGFNDEFPLLVSSRPDGLGIRLLDMIIGIYLAEKLNLPFAFTWTNSLDIPALDKNQGLNKSECGEYINPSMANAEVIFEEIFITKHLVSYDKFGGCYCGNICRCKVKDFEELIDKVPFDKPWGYYSTIALPFSFVENLDKESTYLDLKKSYGAILFSEQFKKIRQYAEEKAAELGDFIAIHIRGGEMIYADSRHYIGFIFGRHFPYEVAIEIINKEIELGRKIIIFGQDIQGDEVLAKFFDCVNVQTAHSILKDYGLYGLQRDFFELSLMSYAKKIFKPRGSTFSLVAGVISGEQKTISYFDLFSYEEIYNIILKNIDMLDVSSQQKAIAHYRLYEFGCMINKDNNILLNHIRQAFDCDRSNLGYMICLFCMLIKMEFFLEAEEIISDSFSEIFFRILLETNYWWRFREMILGFSSNIATREVPFSSFIISKIYESQRNRNTSLAIKFAKLAYEAQPHNEIFQKHLLTLLLQKEKEQHMLPPKVIIKEVLKEKPIPSVYLVSAKDRIHSHLAYKLGQAMILNSKSLLGYIRMPYVLSYIKAQHRFKQEKYQNKIAKNPSLKLPKLESYPDYKEVLKEKECFTYKLGLAFIKANKTWYKGGLFRFCFLDIPRLRRELKEKRK